MASMMELKLTSWITIAMVMGLLFFLMVVISLFLNLSFVGIIVLTIIFILIQWLISPWLVRIATGLRYYEKGENPFLESMVSELAKEAGVPVPRLGWVRDDTPNAFVFGRTPGSASLIVHQGLLTQLNPDEIRAVIGHEIGHIRHRDMVAMTFASAVPLLAGMITRMVLWGAMGRRRDVGPIILIGLISGAVYVLGLLLVRWLSRVREFYADAYSAEVTRDPRALQSALAKITYGLSLSKDAPTGARSFYIGDPSMARNDMAYIQTNLSKYDRDGNGVLDEKELEIAMADESRSSWHKLNEILATHPPTYKRILHLRDIEREMGSIRSRAASESRLI